MIRLPPEGLVGIALREAAGNYLDLVQRVRGALQAAYEAAGKKDVWPDLYAVFNDKVVAREDGVPWGYPYSQTDDGAVTLGARFRVEEQFVATAATAMPAAPAAGALLEALGDEPGRRFKIRVIRAGLSGNGNYYPDAVLREAAPLFNGARVFVKSDAEHLKGQGKDVRNVIGQLSAATFVEGQGPDAGEIQATFDVLQAAGDISARLTEAVGRGMSGLFGFSVDAVGRWRPSQVQGTPAKITAKITKVNSVDLIVEPGAGGAVLNLLEAQGEGEDVLREKMVKLLEASPDALKGRDPATLSDEDIEAAFREAMATPAAPGASAPPVAPDPLAIARQVDAMVGARVYLREAVSASRLPAAARERVARFVEARGDFGRADVDRAVTDERAYLARFTESGRVADLGGGSRIEMGEGRAEKVAAMLDAFFDPAHKDHGQAASFREAYIDITGDRRVTGQVGNCDQGAMREALGSNSFPNVLGDAITRRMVADYRANTSYDIWRQLVTVVPVNDFRTQERTRFGGYGDLPVVAQGDPYASLASPTDEMASYAVAKRGGTEELTIEMIKNDDVGAIRRIPTNLSRAGKRTLAKFVLDILRANPTIYDTKALFHADHGNLGTLALSAATLAAGRLAMLKQAEAGSNDRLGIGPRFLWVAPDNEETAVDLFRRNTNLDQTFVQTLALNVMPVWYWTDVNDWCLSADPLDIPTIEVGFLDGAEEPQLFIQDVPNVGSMFGHDKTTYKIRHIYGAAVVDYRGLYKAVVA